MWEDGYQRRLRDWQDLNPPCSRWHSRVCRARERRRRQEIFALLETATILLVARMDNNLDALDHVLHRAAAQLLHPVDYV
jgi:hypothetical protein